MQFWQSLAKYGWKRIGCVPWRGVGIGVMIGGLVISYGNKMRKRVIWQLGLQPQNQQQIEKTIRYLVSKGDYQTAEKILTKVKLPKAKEEELSKLVKVRERIEEEINKEEKLLKQYPYNEDILKNLVKLSKAVGDKERVDKYKTMLEWVGVTIN